MLFYLVMGVLFSIYALDLVWLVVVAMLARSTEAYRLYKSSRMVGQKWDLL